MGGLLEDVIATWESVMLTGRQDIIEKDTKVLNTSPFVVKDSGKREQFAGGMVRDTQEGKIDYSLALDGPLARIIFDDPLVQLFLDWWATPNSQTTHRFIHELALREGGIEALFDRYALHLIKGAEKYGVRNWMQAIGEAEYERFRASAARHFMQYLRGERDEDHASAVLFNINGAMYVRSNIVLSNSTERFLRDRVG